MVKGGLRFAQGTIAVLPLPFVLAFDVAATSDKCDQLVASLNDLAIRAGAAVHDRIHFLEDRVSLMNRGQVWTRLLASRLRSSCPFRPSTTTKNSRDYLGLYRRRTDCESRMLCSQGLGFVVMGTVVDLKALRNGGIFIGSGGITLVTFLLALGPSNHSHLFDPAGNATACATDSLAVAVLASTVRPRPRDGDPQKH